MYRPYLSLIERTTNFYILEIIMVGCQPYNFQFLILLAISY